VPVTRVDKDPVALTMTVVADFQASVARVWRLWSDPRQLERWWGPPAYPATFMEHDLDPGGEVRYFMTGPDGDRHHGWWRIVAVEPQRRLAFEDGFADDQGEPVADMPTMSVDMTLEARADGGTTMTSVTTFPSDEAMQQILEMGAEEGFRQSLSQIDDILAAEAA
jgi:uncharacterized protein YndB with AHSA1/START domain